jgi:hypothetical protein
MTAVALAAAGVAVAKLPPPDDAAKAKAAETAAKNAWQAKVDAFQLCKAQDRIASKYKASHPEAKAAAAVASAPGPAAAASGPAGTNTAAAAPTPAPKPAAPAAAPEPPAKPPAPMAAASGPQVATTPVAAIAAPNAVTVTPCADPGPFAYAPPEQKPLETSGAHSPAANATSPPSVRQESAGMTTGKTGGAAKQ